MHCTTFETAIGFCGIVWSMRGIASVRLPTTEPDCASMDRLLAKQFPDASQQAPASGSIGEAAINAIVRSLAGENTDEALAALPIDDADIPPFARLVYGEARRIPRGETRSYGEIARALGKPGGARAVGQALGKNPYPLVVPCHRVLASGGAAGGFTAPGGVGTKARILAIEGKQVAW